MIKGQVLGGDFNRVIIRQRAQTPLEIGELLISEGGQGNGTGSKENNASNNEKILLQVYDLLYGSQISDMQRELISGMKLEENLPIEFMDPHLRNYTLALGKSLISLNTQSCRTCKTLPNFFSEVHELLPEDMRFLTKPAQALYLGLLRSGSKALNVPIYVEGEKVLSEHILISASTGKGKSNLTRVLLWSNVEQDYAGLLVLDPHDEYYGRTSLGLKDHHFKEKIVYYTPKMPPASTRTLVINVESLKPQHFNGVMYWSEAQEEALQAYYRKYYTQWIQTILAENEEEPSVKGFAASTIGVIKRRLSALLDITTDNNTISCHGIFDLHAGKNTVHDICGDLEQCKTVIIDTSQFSSSVEILIGSILATEIFHRYKRYKLEGQLQSKPVISIVLEEAPRVLGKEVIEQGHNIFVTLAREGRKFKVGLIAITQLPSLIPRSILANMNTKIILGLEMAPERQAIIESSAQDLSMDARAIASLDKGEAIVSSTFTRFAIPIKIPLFESLVKPTVQRPLDVKGMMLDA